MEKETEIGENPRLVVTEEMRSYIYETTKWANLLAIFGFVISGIMVVGSFTIGSLIQSNPAFQSMAGSAAAAGSMSFTFVFLLQAFIVFYPSLMMFKYASKAKAGVLYGEQANLDNAMAHLKSLFKFWGILVIIFIGFYLLTILLTITATV